MARVVPSQIVTLIDQNLNDPHSSRLSVSHTTVAGLTAIAHLIDELPREFLTISGPDYSDLICAVEAIRNSVAFWQHKGIGEIEISGIHGKSILMILRETLLKCPDQIPSPATAELHFIVDVVLRNSIRLDIRAATSALHNGEWKAATVLAGSAAEALTFMGYHECARPLNLGTEAQGITGRMESCRIYSGSPYPSPSISATRAAVVTCRQ